MIPIKGLSSLFLGSVPAFFSSSSDTPSPSSSVSVTSGSPSPSVSLCTVILNSTGVALLPASSSAFTVTVKSLVSSSLPQSDTVGVPVISPVSLSKLRPSGRPSTDTFEPSSLVSILIGSIAFFSITVLFPGFVISGAFVSLIVTGTFTLSSVPSG